MMRTCTNCSVTLDDGNIWVSDRSATWCGRCWTIYRHMTPDEKEAQGWPRHFGVLDERDGWPGAGGETQTGGTGTEWPGTWSEIQTTCTAADTTSGGRSTPDDTQ